MRGRSLILAYHNVVPDEFQGFGDRSLHLPFSAFERQLEVLEQYCDVVPLAQVLAGAVSRDRPLVALTFDDAYRGAVEFALPELARRELTATVFVAPGLLGRRSFWWDDLSDGPSGLSHSLREHALESGEGRDKVIRQECPMPNRGCPLPEAYSCATEAQVHSLVRNGYVTLGAHTWSHPNLTRIDAASLTDELSKSLDWLRAVPGPTLPFLAYPYGLTSPRVAESAESVGFAGGLLVEGGWFAPESGRWHIPRFNVPSGLSDDGLMLRLSGTIRLSSATRIE